MQLPSILRGESLTRLLQGAAAGAVATMIIGFNWGGWTLGSTAEKQVKDAEQASTTLYWQIAAKVLVSAAFEAQLAGHEVGATPANLDLTDFSRMRARLLFEFEF